MAIFLPFISQRIALAGAAHETAQGITSVAFFIKQLRSIVRRVARNQQT
jgi:hypothetical protein